MPKRKFDDDVPIGVVCIRKPGGKTYWYYTPNRGKPNEGKRVRLPDYGTPEWHEELARIKRGDKAAAYDMRALVNDYKASPAWTGKADSTKATYLSAIGPILDHWGDWEPSEITVTHVITLMSNLADTPSMANMALTVTKFLMKYAVQKGLRADNPAREVDTLDEAEDGAKPITPAAWAAIRDPACPIAVHRLGVLGRYTGQRISDLITMRPCDRDEDGISHKIKKLKNRPHWSFLTPEQAAEVDGWNAPPITPYIIRPDGKAYITDRLRDAWNAYARTEAGKALAEFSPHDLRATKVCDERIAGKTHQQIAAMVGMSIQKVMHYSKHIDQRQAARGA